MNNRSAFIAGASGAVGTQLLERLLAHPDYHQVTVLARKPIAHQHSKLRVHVGNFDELESYAHLLRVDDVFCCLGTTLKRAGSKAAFERVDHQYIVKLAQLAAHANARQFLLVSAIGADAGSTFFYNRVKGRTEQAVRQLDFDAVHIFQPSLLMGPRSDSRPGEGAAKLAMPLFNSLLHGRLRKYRGVHVSEVARCMLEAATADTKGVQVHHFNHA